MTDHPSPLALDRYALGANPAVAAHVDGCDRCRAYVARVSSDPGPAPAVPRPWDAWRLWLAVAAAAAALLLTVRVATDAGAPYVGTKGNPAVVVWVRSAEGVHRWSGEALHPGDSVRLEVAPGPHREVEVRSGGAVLFRGALAGEAALPVSWTLDHAPGPETLQVTLLGGPTPWSTTLEIRKETP